MKNILITIALSLVTLVSFSQTCENVFIPNVFTPNNDGMNDTFEPVFEGSDTLSFEMFIYNRSGSEVFKSRGRSWDGFVNGQLATMGTYIYVVSVGNCRNIKGTLTLLK